MPCVQCQGNRISIVAIVGIFRHDESVFVVVLEDSMHLLRASAIGSYVAVDDPRTERTRDHVA